MLLVAGGAADEMGVQARNLRVGVDAGELQIEVPVELLRPPPMQGVPTRTGSRYRMMVTGVCECVSTLMVTEPRKTLWNALRP